MPFEYPTAHHTRRHVPSGYESYKTYKDWLRDEFTFRCVYCLERERWYPSGQAAFAVDHVKPKGKQEYAHLVCVYENLVYACNRCNSAKSDELVLDPCSVAFAQHLVVREDGTVVGLTTEGKNLIDILGLDLVGPTRTRLYYIRLASLYRQAPHNPEVRELYFCMFGFPDELPDLASLRPGGNSKPEGIAKSYRRQREQGALSQTY
jgi:hypothetical protein